MDRKRKDISPNETNTGGKRQTKNKMTTNNPNQHIVKPGQTLVCMCIYSKIFHIHKQRLDKVDQKLNHLNSVQRSITDLTSRLNSMESKINGIEIKQKITSDQYGTLSFCTKANKKYRAFTV
jgi:hypothetical protein